MTSYRLFRSLLMGATLLALPNLVHASVTFIDLRNHNDVATGGSYGGSSFNDSGTVFLDAPAAVDTVVTLSTSNPTDISLPSSVTVLAGSSSAGFIYSTPNLVSSDESATISADDGVGSDTEPWIVQAVRVRNFNTPALEAMYAGSIVTGKITLDTEVNSDQVISLSSDNPGVTVPASVTVLAGDKSADVPITLSLDATGTANLTADFNSGPTFTLTRGTQPFSLGSVTFLQSSVVATHPNTGMVSLNFVASQNIVITISRGSGGPFELPLKVIRIYAGTSSATFPVHTQAMTSLSKNVWVVATAEGSSKKGNFTVTKT